MNHLIPICLRAESSRPEDRYAALSSREREVLKMMAAGLDNHQIATALAVNKRTVDTYRRRLIQKLGLQSQADLLRYALQHHQPPNN